MGEQRASAKPDVVRPIIRLPNQVILLQSSLVKNQQLTWQPFPQHFLRQSSHYYPCTHPRNPISPSPISNNTKRKAKKLRNTLTKRLMNCTRLESLRLAELLQYALIPRNIDVILCLSISIFLTRSLLPVLCVKVESALVFSEEISQARIPILKDSSAFISLSDLVSEVEFLTMSRYFSL